LTDEVGCESLVEVENGVGEAAVRLSRDLERNGVRVREVDKGTEAVLGGWKRGRVWRSEEVIGVEEEGSV
jgi:hypothetical protein